MKHADIMTALDEGKDLWGYSIGGMHHDNFEDNPPVEGPFLDKAWASAQAEIDSQAAINDGDEHQINWFRAQILDATDVIDFGEVIEQMTNYITESAQVEVDFASSLEDWVKANVSINGHLCRSFVWMLEVGR